MSSIASIRKALETKLQSLDSAIETAWENVDYTPTNNVPYQFTHFLFTEPNNVGMMNSPYLQRGYMQVDLMYPTDQGALQAQQKAEQLRTAFFRGLSVSADGVTTVIEQTPEVLASTIVSDRYSVKVRIRFYAYIGV